MKLLIDFFPIGIFFLVYKFAPESVALIAPLISPEQEAFLLQTKPIMLATAVLIPTTILQILYTRISTGKVEKMHLVTLALVVLLGGATLSLNDSNFIKWKPTVVNWLFAVAFLLSQLLTKKSLLQRMMDANLKLPEPVWVKLNYAWVVFFVLSGAINLWVAYGFSEAAWVNFKLFGMLGLTLVFIVLQSIFLYKYIKQEQA